jgi:hypothetical protein
MFELAGLTVPEGPLPCGDHTRKILGMERIARCPTLELIERFAEVVKDGLVDERDLAIGIRHCNESRDSLDDLMKRELVVFHTTSIGRTIIIAGVMRTFDKYLLAARHFVPRPCCVGQPNLLRERGHRGVALTPSTSSKSLMIVRRDGRRCVSP